MPTLYSRIIRLQAINKIRVLSLADRQYVGKFIVSMYFKQSSRPTCQRIVSLEPEGEFLVLSYPKSFLPKIDEFLEHHFPVVREKRQRLKAQKIRPIRK